MLSKVTINLKTVELNLFSSKRLLKRTWNLNFPDTKYKFGIPFKA
jgi:hypothetical protein